MKNVWLCCPSARPVHEVNRRMDKWRAQGYKIALVRDQVDINPLCHADFAVFTAATWGNYPGFQVASNRLIREVFEYDQDCDWIVSAGDDTDPDPTKRADEIAKECSSHFYAAVECCYPPKKPRAAMTSKYTYAGGIGKESGSWIAWSTFGIMQPTGDRWGSDEPWARQMHPTQPAYIDRICGSPWIGREYARRINGGKGPFWEEYGHMFADEEMQNVALNYGVLWQRPDLTHFHDHCKRDGVDRTPAFLVEAYSPQHWEKNKAVFTRRKAAGFPGSEPIA